MIFAFVASSVELDKRTYASDSYARLVWFAMETKGEPTTRCRFTTGCDQIEKHNVFKKGMMEEDMALLAEAFIKLDLGRILSIAAQDEYKESPFLLKELLSNINGDIIDTMWKELDEILSEGLSFLFNCRTKGSPDEMREPVIVKNCVQLFPYIRACIELASIFLKLDLPLSPGLLHTIGFLNRVMPEIPPDLVTFKDCIADICEELSANTNFRGDKKLITYNVIIYLIKQTLMHKRENDVQRLYAMRSVLPKLIHMREVDSNEVLSLYKQCAKSPLYLSMPEGRKVISSFQIKGIKQVSTTDSALKSVHEGESFSDLTKEVQTRIDLGFPAEMVDNYVRRMVAIKRMYDWIPSEDDS
ncbi:condensin-2 complex subunit G2 [Nephila pilipes]|uniref:Condensin-2 complex subunit G2 n=1 Tax=Nephila pilipes TaxID=299642 RepID=A0A8X6QYB2_NEPPI|nr:condensin-2 complex subunit G2 [Nephila pilipes]